MHDNIAIITETINRLITLKQMQQSVALANSANHAVGLAKVEAYQDAIDILQSVLLQHQQGSIWQKHFVGH